jgi:hypothetical protein
VFSCADYHAFTAFGSAIALGSYSGEAYILDATTLNYVKTISQHDVSGLGAGLWPVLMGM